MAEHLAAIKIKLKGIQKLPPLEQYSRITPFALWIAAYNIDNDYVP